jgi:hypothetical protein
MNKQQGRGPAWFRLVLLGLACLALARPAQAGAAGFDIRIARSIEFARMDTESAVPIPARARDYLTVGDTLTFEYLRAKAAGKQGDLVLANIRHYDVFRAKVLADAARLYFPGKDPSRVRCLTMHQVINITCKLVARTLRYDFALAAAYGRDDINNDGVPDGFDKGAFDRIPDEGLKRRLRMDPPAGLKLLRARVAEIERLSMDELYDRGAGVCRHMNYVALGVFRVLKEANPHLRNVYMSSIMSRSDNHAWLQAAYVQPGAAVFAFYDPTGSADNRLATAQTSKDATGTLRYTGIPTTAELAAYFRE